MELIALTAFLSLVNTTTVAASSVAVDAIRGEQEGIVIVEDVSNQSAGPQSLLEALRSSK